MFKGIWETPKRSRLTISGHHIHDDVGNLNLLAQQNYVNESSRGALNLSPVGRRAKGIGEECWKDLN